MAERFGTSQAPVREAFALLRREGLLISLPNRGTFVTTVSEADAFLAYQVRILIEPRIAALALPALTATDRVAMWEDVEAMASAAAQSDLQAFTERDMAFHGRLYERSADMLGARIWMSISSTVRQFMSAAGGRFVDDLDLADVASMHRRLLDHVDRHDAASLADELTRHLTADWDVLSQPTRQEGLPK